MEPIHVNQCNFTYVAPPSMPECGPLPCRRELTGDNQTTTSWWLPSDEERATIAAGGLIVFTAYMNGHPPVSLSSTPHPYRAPLQGEMNPHHPTNIALRDQWPKLFVAHMLQRGVREVLLSNSDIEALHAPDLNIAIKPDTDGIRIFLLTDDEARKTVAGEGGKNPPGTN